MSKLAKFMTYRRIHEPAYDNVRCSASVLQHDREAEHDE